MRNRRLTRRGVLRRGVLAGGGLVLPLGHGAMARGAGAIDAKVLAAVNDAALFKEYRRGPMVHEYYVHRLRAIARQRAAAREAIRTPEDVMRLRREVREKLRACFGPLPERTPLRARVTGKLEREHYTIEKVIYESQPEYLVTANLYVPKGASGRRPAVLGTCGHSSNGKAMPVYQAFARNLARQGYVVLLYDPPSQGERLEYPNRAGQPRIGVGVHSHNLAANQMALVGRSFAAWEAWDGIRGLDYLLSRPEVDPKRLGVTGNSGGGTQTMHLTALDDRFSMAAPSCFVTRYRYNLENEEPTDAEQVVPGVLAAGLDMADMFIAQLPRPTILIGQSNDFFDVRGLRETYEELRRLYTIVGAEKNIALFVGPLTHGYSQAGREAMYGFFNRHAGVAAAAAEPGDAPEPESALQVTPAGQVQAMGSRRSFDFTRDRARVLTTGRKPVAGDALRKAIGRQLALPKRSGTPHYRVMRARSIWSRPRLRDYGFAVETEPRIVALLHAVTPSESVYYFRKGERATVYVAHRSALKETILGQAPKDPDTGIHYAIDVRGVGELTARTSKDSGDDFFHYYHSDYMHANQGLMLAEPYCGRRVHDVLRILDLFAGNGYRDVHLVGRGLGAIAAAFAGVVHPLVKRVTLHHALLSYHEVTQDPRYAWPFSSLVFGVLKAFDLPDCLRELAAHKRLAVVDPWNSRMQPWDRDRLDAHLASLGLEGIPICWSTAAL